MEFKVICPNRNIDEALAIYVKEGYEPISIGVGLAGNVRQINAIGERDWDEIFERGICILMKKD